MMHLKKTTKITFYFISFAVIFILCNGLFTCADDFEFSDWITNNIDFKNLITAYGVNGRYLGNIAGITLAPFYLNGNKFIITLIKSIILFLICFFCSSIVKKSDNKYKNPTFIVLMIFIGRISWEGCLEPITNTASFMNHILPMVFITLMFLKYYDYFFKNKKIHSKNKIYSILPFILSFITCLFAEHISLYLTFILLVLIIGGVINKCVNRTGIYLFAGSFFGTVFMFAHNLVNNKCDEQFVNYRGTVFGDSFLKLLFSNFIKYSYLLLFSRVILTGILFLCSAFIVFIFGKKNRKTNFISVICVLISLFSLIVSFFSYFTYLENTSLSFISNDLVKAVTTFLCYLSFGFIIIFNFPKKKSRNVILFLYFSIAVIFCELLLVSPVGLRCFFITDIFWIIIFAIIISEIRNNISLKVSVLFFSLLFLITSAYYGYTVNLLYKANSAYYLRQKYITEQMNENKKEILIPGTVYLSSDGWWLKNYYYYNQRGDIVFVEIPLEEWMDEYKNAQRYF